MWRGWFVRAGIMTSLVVVAWACTSSGPAPEPIPSPSPTLPGTSCVIDADCRVGLVCVVNRCTPPSTVVDGGTVGSSACAVPCAADQTCVGTVCVGGGIDAGAGVFPAPTTPLPAPTTTSTSPSPFPSPSVNPCLNCPTGYTCDPNVGICSPPLVLGQ